MHLRRTIALTTGALLSATVLTSCGFDYATDRVYTPGVGVNNRDASVDVLAAVIVSGEPGKGTFIASFANNSTEEPASVEALEGVDAAQITAKAFSPVEVPAGGLVNLAEDGGLKVTGDFEAGNVVPVSLQFDNGERVQLEVPVVTSCGVYEGLDGTAPCQEPAEPESESH